MGRANDTGISEGSGLGLTREWAERLAATDVEKRQALCVQRLSARMKPAPAPNAPAATSAAAAADKAAAAASAPAAADALQAGDLLLAVDGAPVSTFRAVEDCVLHKPSVALTLLRDGAERQLTSQPSRVASDGTVHIVMWCGLVVQEAYRAVLERGFEPETGGVYISYYLFGSPAHKHKLVPKHWVVELNGQPVPDIPGFVRLINGLKHGESCRVKTCDLTGRVSAYTLKTDHWYWRSYEVKREQGEWVQRFLGPPVRSDGE